MASGAVVLSGGNEVRLLEGSAQLFPAMAAAMDAARRSIQLETYIFDVTAGGAAITEALERAAARGVSVQVLVDGLGTPPLPKPWPERLAAAGVEWRVYSPPGLLGMLVPGRWRRMHRKLCVVDGQLAFCGGINILDDFHDPNHGALQSPRFDFAVRIEGPLVRQVQESMDRLWFLTRETARDTVRSGLRSLAEAMEGLRRGRPAPGTATPGGTRAGLILRDNLRHRAQIEKAYLKAIGNAHEEVIVANAYFVPGRKLRRALVLAARRGVRVRLLLQGRYEYFMQYYSSRPVYGALLRAGAEIHEYSPSFLHAKVAVVDGHWATVGSSNLDPLSLLLAREANVVVESREFAGALRDRLVRAMQEGGEAMDAAHYANRPFAERVKEKLALVVMRLALLVHGKEYL